MQQWNVSGPETLSGEDTVRRVVVSVVMGGVDVVATDEPGWRLEVSELDGPALQVRLDETGELRIGYDDGPLGGFLGLSRRSRRHVVLSVRVPRDAEARVRVVSASAVVAGLAGAVSVDSVSGDVTGDALTGGLRLKTVSGVAELRSVDDHLDAKTVSGDVTVVGGQLGQVAVKTVSGDVTLDLTPEPHCRMAFTSVSGALLVRMPEDGGEGIDVTSVSGSLHADVEGIRMESKPGRNHFWRDAAGGGSISATTVSGDVTLVLA